MKAVNANVEGQARFIAALRKVSFEAPGGSSGSTTSQNAIIPTYIRRVDKVGASSRTQCSTSVQDVRPVLEAAETITATDRLSPSGPGGQPGTAHRRGRGA